MAVFTPYAFTEEYVVPGGAGANDGSSFANAWDITQVAASIAAGKRFNLAGNFTLAAQLTWSSPAGTDGNPVATRGWKADLSVPATSFSDMPKIDGAGSHSMVIGTRNLLSGFRFTNGGGIVSTALDSIAVDLCEIDNHTGTGLSVDDDLRMSRSRVHSNGSHGIQTDLYNKIMFSEFYDNGGVGAYHRFGRPNIQHCFFARNSYGLGGGTFIGGSVVLCTFDDHDSGSINASTSAPMVLIANQFTNEVSALGNLGTSILLNNNFFGNTSDGTTTPHLELDSTTLNPQYVNIANNDYEIQNASLIGVNVPPLGNVNIGAWQSNSGGGGAAGMIVHPGMAGGLRG